jgi:hypothetical protein
MHSLYIPSTYMMMKVMRACICVEEPEDLWIYDLTK